MNKATRQIRSMQNCGHFALLAIMFTPIACTPAQSAAPPQFAKSSTVVLGPDSVWLGQIRPGQIGRKTFSIRNVSPEVIRIDRFASSCPCLRLSPSQFEIAPNVSAVICATFDHAEPDFRGGLEIVAAATTRDGAICFETKIRLEVSDIP
jgi:hypothetical protein